MGFRWRMPRRCFFSCLGSFTLGMYWPSQLHAQIEQSAPPPSSRQTQRLKHYYEEILREDPSNERARAFLFPTEKNNSALTESPPDSITPSAPLDWTSLPLEERWASWQTLWESASPRKRLELVESALEYLPEAQWPLFFDAALSLTAPGESRRWSWAQEWIRVAAESSSASAVQDYLTQRGRSQADANLLVAAANLAALQGNAEHWCSLLGEAGRINPQQNKWRHQEWEAALAQGNLERAREIVQTWRTQTPQDTAAWLAAMETEILAGDEAEAWAILQKERSAPLQDKPSPHVEAKAQGLLEFSSRLAWAPGQEAALRWQLELAPADPERALALLEHLQAWRKFPEAQTIAQEFPHGSLPEAAQRNFLMRWAQMRLPREGASAAAEALRPALSTASAPANEEVLLLMSEYLVLAEQHEEAARLLQEHSKQAAFLPSRRLDRRLFEVLQKMKAPALANARADGAGPDALQDVIPHRPGYSPAVRALLQTWEKQTLQDSSSASPSSALRLARFWHWTGEDTKALSLLLRTRSRWPQEISVHQEILELGRALQDTEIMEQSLNALVRLDAANREEWQRQLGFALLERDQDEEGMRILQDRVRSAQNPSAAQRDVALGWQMLEAWFSSAEAWQAAWEKAATPEDQEAARRGWLAVQERLSGMPSLLPDWPNEANGANGPTALAPNAAALSPALSHFAAPASPFVSGISGSAPSRTLRTLDARNAAAWKAAGALLPEAEKATFWQEAAQRFPRDAEILQQAAAALRQDDKDGPSADYLLQAWKLDPPDAARAFSVAQELEKISDRTRAQDFYELAATLDAPTPGHQEPYPAFLPLNPEEETAAAEALYRVRRDGSSWSGAWSILVPAHSPSPPSIRLQALYALGYLARHTPDKSAWLQRWQALPSAQERAFALAGMEQTDLLLHTLREARRADPLDYAAAAAYFEAALAWGQKSGEGNERALWAQAADEAVTPGGNVPEQVDFFLRAVGRWARQQPNVDALEWERILTATPERRALLWPVACLLAESGHLESALLLAGAAWEFLPENQRAEAALRALEWACESGSLAWARHFSQLETGDFPDLTHPSAALWRARWLLATPEERESWLRQMEQSAEPSASLPENARFLLEALAGWNLQETAAERILHLSAAHFSQTDPQALAALLRAEAAVLVAWKLPEAAIAMLQAIENSDPALLTLRGQLSSAQQAELNILASSMLLAAKAVEELPLAWDSLMASSQTNGAVAAAIARQLEELQEWPHAAWVWRHLLQKLTPRSLSANGLSAPPQNTGTDPAAEPLRALAMQRLLHATQLLGETEGVAQVIAPHLGSSPADQEVLVWLIDNRLSEMDWPGAQALLARYSPEELLRSPLLLARWTALHLLLGDQEAVRKMHAPLWEKDRNAVSGEVLSRLALQPDAADAWWAIAQQLPTPEAQKRSWEAALAWVAAQMPPGYPAALSHVQKEAWHRALRKILLRTFPENTPQSAAENLRLAAVFGDESAWEERISAPAPLSAKELATIAQVLQDGFLSPVWRTRWQERIEQAPDTRDPAFWVAWEGLDALEEPAWIRLMESWWKGGQGNLFAGEALLRAYARQGDADNFRQVFSEYLALNPPSAALEALCLLLEERNLAPLALEVGAYLPPSRTNHPNAHLRQARLLHQAGRHEEAEALLSSWRALSILSPTLLLPLAETYMELGNPRQAMDLLQASERSVPSSMRKALLARAAQAALQMNDFAAAEEFLRRASFLSGPPALAEIFVEWMKKNGRLDVVEASEIELWLKGRDRADFRLLVAKAWQENGQTDLLQLWLQLHPALARHPQIAAPSIRPAY